MGDNFVSPHAPRYLSNSRQIFGCHNESKDITGVWWVETRDVAEHPTVPRTSPWINNGIFHSGMSAVARLRSSDVIPISAWAFTYFVCTL